MEVRHRKEISLARGEPFLGGGALTLRTMAITTAVVGDDRVGAALAARHMAAERRRAAALDGRHHLHLVEADVSGIGFAPRRPVVAELWRSACSVTPLRIPAASAASWNRRLSWRVVIGLPGLWPGNSQRSAMGVVESKPRRRVFHHWRNRSSVSGDSMTLRSLRPLDCSTRMIFCALSICLTFSLTTSPARRPQP